MVLLTSNLQYQYCALYARMPYAVSRALIKFSIQYPVSSIQHPVLHVKPKIGIKDHAADFKRQDRLDSPNYPQTA
jgi:hypothetical protein